MKEPFRHNFGLWSGKDIRRVSDLLTRLGVRFETFEAEEGQDVLEAWHAWDPTSQKPNIGHELWIHEEDIEKVGDHIVNMFPERRF